MKKLKALVLLIIAVLAGSLVGCSNTDKTETTSETEQTPVVEETIEQEVVDESVVEEDSEIVKALKAKYNYQDATEFITSSGQSMMIKLNEGYTYEVLNSIDEETEIETVVEFTSGIQDKTIYHIKIFDIPVEQKDFLLKNPLRIADTTNESTNTFIDLICIDNKESDTTLKVMNNNGEEHKVIKYEVNLDMTILGIENLNLHRETPTYYSIENGDSYIGMLITEEILTDDDIRLLEANRENGEDTDELVEITEEIVDESINDENIMIETENYIIEEIETVDENIESSDNKDIKVEENTKSEIIIESSLTEDEKAAEEIKHVEEVNEVYNELDTKTQNHIEVIKNELLKKDLGSAEEQEKRLENIDKEAFDFISNIMLGRFDKY